MAVCNVKTTKRTTVTLLLIQAFMVFNIIFPRAEIYQVQNQVLVQSEKSKEKTTENVTFPHPVHKRLKQTGYNPYFLGGLKS